MYICTCTYTATYDASLHRHDVYCQSINQSSYFIVRPQVDQLSLLHVGITKTEKNKTKT